MKPKSDEEKEMDHAAKGFGIALVIGVILAFVLLFLSWRNTEAGGQYIDPRLAEIRVTVIPAQDCESGCWKIKSLVYYDGAQAQNRQNFKLRAQIGDWYTVDYPWRVAYPDGLVPIVTKGEEWADFPIFACYDYTVTPGPYRAWMGENEAQSDVISGFGLPNCTHIEIEADYEYFDGYVHSNYLPLVVSAVQ